MKKILIWPCLITSFSVHAGDLGTQDVLVMSKMAGVCGVMKQMAVFQTSTMMPGGDAFIERFWSAEFARLGKSKETFLEECVRSSEFYAEMWNASEQKQ